MKEYLKIRESIINTAQSNEKINKTTNDIVQNFVNNTKLGGFSEQDYINAWKELPQENKNLSVMDLYNTPEIKDDDLSLLSWFLWWSKFVRKNVDGEPYITHEWFVKLNNVLDMASKHARRNWLWVAYFRKSFGKDWLDIMDFVWKETEKIDQSGNITKMESSGEWKIYFRIKTKEQYFDFLEKLTAPKNNDLANKEKNGFFLKNVLALWYLWRNEVYLQKRKLFQYLITDLFGKFFDHKFNVRVDTDNHGDHGHNITESFDCTLSGKELNVKLKWNVKSEKSTVDKIMREKTANATNDIIRFQLTFKNHKQMVDGLYAFLQFCMNNDSHIFDHEPWNFWNLKGIDKWWLESENKYYSAHIDSLPDGQIKDFIKWIEYKVKNWSSKDYKDVKLIVPVRLKWVLFNIEVQFLTQDYGLDNNRWYSSHAILKWAEKIWTLCRHKKFVTEPDIKKIVQNIIVDSPELVDQLASGNEKRLSDELFDYYLNKCEKINIPWHKTVYLFKWVKETLDNNSFWPHI